MPLQIKVEELTADTAVITFDGSLTLGMSLSLVDSQIRGFVEKGLTKIVFNLASVAYCDSAGLGLIVHTFGLTTQKGGMLRLCCLSDRVAGVLKMTTTDSFLPVDADQVSSVSALS